MSSSKTDTQAMRWIEMTLTPDAECSDDLFNAGFALNILAHEHPDCAWEVILKIVAILNEEELLSGTGNAQKLASNLAAGPLESLLATHGKEFIERLEQEATVNLKFTIVLDGVWKNGMADEAWASIRSIASKRLGETPRSL